MIGLSPTLVAAQQAAVRTPYVRVNVSRQITNVRRLDWVRIYVGAEPDAHHAAACAADGSLTRVRVTNEASRSTVWGNRVAVPGMGAPFGAWVAIHTDAYLNTNVGMNASPYRPGDIWLAFFNGGGDRLVGMQSTDYGATWTGPWDLALLPTATPGHCSIVDSADAAPVPSTGYRLAVYSEGGNTLKVCFWSYAALASFGPFACPSAFGSITGLHVFWGGNVEQYPIVLAGTEPAGNPKVWTVQYAPATNTWSDLKEVTAASASSGVAYAYPFAVKADVYRLIFAESYAGAQPYNRPFWTHAMPSATYQEGIWREPVPFNYPPNPVVPISAPFGLAATAVGNLAYLTAPSGVWQAEIHSVVGTDLSADVVALEMTEAQDSGGVEIHLPNHEGQYNVPGAAGLSDLQRGAQIAVSLGYCTAAGAEAAAGPTFWVDHFEWRVTAGDCRLVVHGVDGWALLERWVARRQFSWPAGTLTIWEMLRFVVARAGIDCLTTGATSSELMAWQPAFTIHPGESAKAAVQSLLAMVPDELFFAGGRAYVTRPAPTDASTYTLGTDHPIYEGRYTQRSFAPNRTQVFGDGVFGETFHWSEINRVYDAIAQIRDLNQASGANATTRAGTALAAAARHFQADHICIPPHCGAQVWDCVRITAPQVSLNLQKRRIVAIATKYSRTSKAIYEQHLTLASTD